MPSKVVCFWLEPTNMVQVSFRRYRASGEVKCGVTRIPYPGHTPVVWGYHDESVVIETRERCEPNDHGDLPTVEQQADPRWPKKCACGYEFSPTDHWQINVSALYMTEQWGLVTVSDAPAGAMYDAHWYRAEGDKATPDGKNLVLKTPEGDWHIDGPASNGPGWQRTGVPPNITCNPSIRIGQPQRMHGWLRNGVLEIDFP